MIRIGLAYGISRLDPGSLTAHAMHAHDGTEHTVLEPACDQLAEAGVIDIAAMETADISGPSRNAAETDVQSASDLSAK